MDKNIKPADGVSATPPGFREKKRQEVLEVYFTEEQRLDRFWAKLKCILDVYDEPGTLCYILSGKPWDQVQQDYGKGKLHIQLYGCPLCCSVGEYAKAGDFIELVKSIRDQIGVETIVFHWGEGVSSRFSARAIAIEQLDPASLIREAHPYRNCRVMPTCSGVKWRRDQPALG